MQRWPQALAQWFKPNEKSLLLQYKVVCATLLDSQEQCNRKQLNGITVDIIYTCKERVSEVFPTIKLWNYKWLMPQLDNSGWHQAVLPPDACHVFCIKIWVLSPKYNWKSETLPPILQAIRDCFPPGSEWLLDPDDPRSMDMELHKQVMRVWKLGISVG